MAIGVQIRQLADGTGSLPMGPLADVLSRSRGLSDQRSHMLQEPHGR